LANLRAEALDSHDRVSFTCGVEPLDRYLKQQASQDVRSGVAAVFVLTPGDGSIAGYYSLSTSTINLSDISPHAAKKLPRYPVVPTTLLGRLAVHKAMQGRGIGEALLFDAFKRAQLTTKDVGSWALIVDAKDESAKRFYERYEFLSLLNQPMRLYLPMSEIRLLLARISK
jgi:GNAT superfamily N-acetyltransferase